MPTLLFLFFFCYLILSKYLSTIQASPLCIRAVFSKSIVFTRFVAMFIESFSGISGWFFFIINKTSSLVNFTSSFDKSTQLLIIHMKFFLLFPVFLQTVVCMSIRCLRRPLPRTQLNLPMELRLKSLSAIVRNQILCIAVS